MEYTVVSENMRVITFALWGQLGRLTQGASKCGGGVGVTKIDE